jgi:aryl-alcohol dehydrogenase-like predicted oxidoreductase
MFEKTEHMARQWAAERRIDIVQVVYSLMNRESSRLISELGAQGVAIFARESLANGFLSGRITKDTVFESSNLNARYSAEEIAARADYAETLSFLVRPPIGNLPQAAVRWVLDNDQIAVVLSGAKTTNELKDWLEASRHPPFDESEHERARAVHTRDFQAA